MNAPIEWMKEIIENEQWQSLRPVVTLVEWITYEQ